jgi:sugar phosphate isomerase/epimerase
VGNRDLLPVSGFHNKKYLMASPIKDFSRLCIHTQTTRAWDLKACVKNYAEAGIHGITIWRNILEDQNLPEVKKLLDDHGMIPVSLCRGGFFPSIKKEKREEAIRDNLWAIEQAAVVGAPLIVLVCGADGQQQLEKSREQIMEGIIRILPAARDAKVRLAIEPLHPMYAGDRSAVNTMKQANDMAGLINSEWVGVAVDVYHVWWDDNLKTEIDRCAGQNHLFAFHICDWNVPTTDFLNDRGLMGEGCINIPEIRSWVEDAGFNGYNEVEIFSTKFWATDQKEYLQKIKQAYLKKS